MGRRLVHAVPSSKMYSPHRHQQAEPHSDRVYHSRTITCSSDISQVPGGYHHRQGELEPTHRFHHKKGEQDSRHPTQKSEDLINIDQGASIQDPRASTGGVYQPRMGSSSSDKHQEAGVCTSKGSKVRLKQPTQQVQRHCHHPTPLLEVIRGQEKGRQTYHAL